MMQVRPVELKDKVLRLAQLLARRFYDSNSLKPLELRFPLDDVPGMNSVADVLVIVAIVRHEPNKSGVVFDGSVLV